MVDETKTIYSGTATLDFDFTLQWWRFRRQFKRWIWWIKRWKYRQWVKKNPEQAKIFEKKIQNTIDEMAHDLDEFLAYGDK